MFSFAHFVSGPMIFVLHSVSCHFLSFCLISFILSTYSVCSTVHILVLLLALSGIAPRFVNNKFQCFHSSVCICRWRKVCVRRLCVILFFRDFVFLLIFSFYYLYMSSIKSPHWWFWLCFNFRVRFSYIEYGVDGFCVIVSILTFWS